MILTRLKEYADTRMTLPPAMYRTQPVRWFINLTLEGELEGLTPLGGTSKADKRGLNLTVPDLVRSSGIKPKLLADNGEYVLGIGRDDADNKKVLERHQQFKALVALAAHETQDSSLKAIMVFLDAWRPDRERIRALAPGYEPADVMTFRVNDQLPTDAVSVQRFWEKYTANATEGTQDQMGQCLITGEIGVIESMMPGKVKGLPGGQASGTSLVSANAKAFEHYGISSSYNSPISRDAAERFTKALNELISTERSRVYVGNLVYTFWTKEKTVFNAWKLLSNPEPEDIKQLFTSTFSGSEVHIESSNQFYALALSASGGRAVIRDWLETTIPEAQTNLERFFSAQSVIANDGLELNHFGVYALAASLYRDANKEMTPNIPKHFIRVALKGGSFPLEIIEKAVRRTRAESGLTHPRVAALKLALATSPGGEAFMDMTTLNPSPPLEPRDALAYQCGRLLAELEAIQRAALGKINSTIVDRYYGSASSTPQNGFAPLLSGVQAHLSKLRKNRAGTYIAKQRALEDILDHFRLKDGVPDLPTQLTMREQGIFAIGYWHQSRANRAAAEAAKQAQVTQNNTGGN
jgi:CRISPR-associated protein Csd1